MTKTLIIIPAAGYGTRMGLLPHESKELIPDPYNDNKPLIDWHLDLAKEETNKLVITREEKTDLIDYLAEEQIFTLLINDVSKEWPNSVLYSKISWEETNILVLPDTRWKYDETKSCIIWDIQKELETHDLVFAVHEVEDVSKWGFVNLNLFPKIPTIEGTQEKPPKTGKDEGFAWGIIGFRNNVGEELFQAYLDKTYFDLTKFKTSVIFLDKFQDVCRTGKIEEY